MVVQQKLMTVQEFEQFANAPENVDRRFELINGEIVEKLPNVIHAAIIGLLATILNNFQAGRRLGWVLVEARYELPHDEHNSKIPDLSFIANPDLEMMEGAIPFMPDLAVEVQSPGQGPKLMGEKAAYYLANGSRLVWLIYPDKRLIEVLTPDDRVFLTEEDTLGGGDVLPGFSVVVRDIFPPRK